MTDFDIQSVKRSQIIQMLSAEQKVRYSKGVQEAYTNLYHAQFKNPSIATTNFSIEKEIQKFILRQFGYKDDETSLKEYWKIPSTYWNDEEVKNSIFYMKFNIFQHSKVSVGDDIVDATLITYPSNQDVSLVSLQRPDRPLVLLAGSMT